jgi:hypothetical protein
MLVFGTGGLSDFLTPEQEEELKELLALRMQQMLEEAGWGSSFGRDPILILISIEEGEDNPESEE